jgi:hypothetical protein
MEPDPPKLQKQKFFNGRRYTSHRAEGSNVAMMKGKRKNFLSQLSSMVHNNALPALTISEQLKEVLQFFLKLT